jgi:signal transduction histidine kinase
MSPAAVAQLAFAAEFALFLVAVAGLACALRPDLLSRSDGARSFLAAGFLGLATASFLRGALVITDPRAGFLLGLRVTSVVLVAAGTIRWRGRRSRVAVIVGLLLSVAASALVRTSHDVAADVVRAAAAAALAAALVWAARRSISARITVNAAALVLAVVVVVAVAVSVSVADSVDGQAKDRASARAVSEAQAVVDQARTGLGPARVVSGVLAGERADALDAVAGGGSADPAAAVTLTQALVRLSSRQLLDLDDPVLFVTGEGTATAAAPSGLAVSTRLALAGDAVVGEALRQRGERQGVSAVGAEVFAVAATPVVVRPTGAAARFTGVVVVARRIDQTYLRVLGTGGEGSTFALVLPRQVVARTGTDPSRGELQSVAADVVDRAGRPKRQVGDRFVAAAPIKGGDGRAVAAFVVSSAADVADASRVALFRTLFVVSLVAAVVALALAVLVGERIGRGLGRLTAAVRRMQDGELDADVSVRSGDELGVLGGAFTSMARSIQAQNAQLETTARDEAALRARLEAVVTGMSEALLAVDAEGRVLELNRAAQDLLGIDRADAVGCPVGEVVRWRPDGGTVAPFDPALFPDREPVPADLVVAEATVPVVVTAGALRDPDGEGGPAGSVVVLRDVRREREVDDLKASILANIGHELRTPLTPIKGYAGMLRDRRLTEEQTRSFAGEIVGGVDQLERVVAQLVTFATIAAGRLDLALEPIDPADLGDRLQARWAARVGPDHQLQVHVADDAPTVAADPVLIDRVVDELIDNAVKYSPSGGPVAVAISGDDESIKVVERSTDSPMVDRTRALVLTVGDRGEGIEAERLTTLTTAFSQGDASTTRRFGGLGLGLASADRIARAHGGTLRFASAVGEGTVVTLWLPADQVGKDGRP